ALLRIASQIVPGPELYEPPLEPFDGGPSDPLPPLPPLPEPELESSPLGEGLGGGDPAPAAVANRHSRGSSTWNGSRRRHCEMAYMTSARLIAKRGRCWVMTSARASPITPTWQRASRSTQTPARLQKNTWPS